MHEERRVGRHDDQHSPGLGCDHVCQIAITSGEGHVGPHREDEHNGTQPQTGSSGEPACPWPRDGEVDEPPSSEKDQWDEYRHEVERTDIADATPQFGRVPGSPEHDVPKNQQNCPDPDREGRPGQSTADDRRDRQCCQEHATARPDTEKPEMVSDGDEPFNRPEAVRRIGGKQAAIPEAQLVVGLKQRKRQCERTARCRRVVAEQRGDRDDQPYPDPTQQPPPLSAGAPVHSPHRKRAEHQGRVVRAHRHRQPQRQPCRDKRRPTTGSQPSQQPDKHALIQHKDRQIGQHHRAVQNDQRRQCQQPGCDRGGPPIAQQLDSGVVGRHNRGGGDKGESRDGPAGEHEAQREQPGNHRGVLQDVVAVDDRRQPRCVGLRRRRRRRKQMAARQCLGLQPVEGLVVVDRQIRKQIVIDQDSRKRAEHGRGRHCPPGPRHRGQP